MKVAATLLLLFAPVAAGAAGFEACDLVGELSDVEVTVATEGSTVYAFEVTIAAAARAKVDGERSDTDCSGHVGKKMSLDLVLPDSAGVPKVGDRLAFERVAEDEVGGGSSANYEFQALNPQSP
jgi:hypothetical protein